MQKLFINNEEVLIKRSFSAGPNGPFVLEKKDGSFIYASGKQVEVREHLDHLPPEHIQRAYEWFDGKDKPVEAPPEKVKMPEDGKTLTKREQLKAWGVKVPFGAKKEDVDRLFEEAQNGGSSVS